MKKFLQDESGAVTVDWVVLTAASIGMGVAVTSSIGDGVTDLADRIALDLTNTSLVLPIDDAAEQAWNYTPFNDEAWDNLMTEVRDKFTGASAAEMIDNVLSDWIENDGSVSVDNQDVYAAVQIVYEEQGYTLPGGMPDMRDF